ncbi:hypothetical protein HNQ80_004044 [Anaerosolibacter carboniphilus]|uniref:Uncharacterized protein n=1 Tax=Anaerosolibacter carboniphilus TaxID=1417629 RepID=A0A841L007_9FIRM|nr:hypothetical protein [Anaerosolibacter carboniphilus]MBB6217908.1 hypothetical protein [Anaerosolibacter carboniphilus]
MEQCSNYYNNKISFYCLQGDDSWAGIDSKIRGNRQNTAVTEALIDEICRISPSKPYDELKRDFDEMSKTYAQVRSGASEISTSIEQIGNKINEDTIIRVLVEVIEKPDLTD